MDNHTGKSHDMPDYVPNWPVVVTSIKVVRVRVYQDTTFLGEPCWRWEHACSYRGGSLNYSYPQDTHALALAGALKHARGCW